MRHIFREYDIRGIFQKDLTEESVTKIGYLLGKRIEKIGKEVVLSYDARTHSPTIFQWLARGLKAAGMEIYDGGMVPTPVNYFCCFNSFEIEGKKVAPVAGVQITGSHNPPEYNGLKITIGRLPFYGKQIAELGREAEALEEVPALPERAETTPLPALESYVAYLAKEFASLKGYDPGIALDCGNGVAGVALEPLLGALEIPFRPLYCEPDGTFPNHHPDPSEEENLRDLQALLQEGVARYGFAFDGDGDRLAFLSRKHNFKGDMLALFVAQTLENPTVIGEVKCSQVMYDEIDRLGTAIMHKTGHSNLKMKLHETGAQLAAEVSGHFFFNDRYFGFDDAIYTMMRLLEMLKEGFDFDGAFEALPRVYSTDEIKIETTEGEKFAVIERLKEWLLGEKESLGIAEIIEVDGVRVLFTEGGWGLVRASNTTPVLVTRFEAPTPERLEEIREVMSKWIDKALG